jgi:NADPH:quinone reductase-like Zn-dependent oxidoreductase
MLLHEQQLFRVPAGISDMQAVLLEPSAVALHAVLRRVPKPGDRVLIIGAGTIGQLILQVVRVLAPEAEVCVLARHPFQVERAARMGAQIIYPQDSYQEVQRATGAQLYKGILGNQMLLGGYDVIYDTVGSKRTTHNSLRWARADATVVMVGLSLHRMLIDLTPIWYQEINLIGTLGHGIESWPIGTSEKRPTFEIAAEMIENRQIFPDKLITHSFSLSSYRNALLAAADKGHNRAIKVIFDYSMQPPSVVPNVRAAARQRQRALAAPPRARLSQPLTPPPDEQGTSYPEEDIPLPPETVSPLWPQWTPEAPESVPATIDRVTSDQEIPTQKAPIMPDSVLTSQPEPETGWGQASTADEETGRVSVEDTFTEEDDKTVIVSAPKRGRTKRKTGAMQATPENQQQAPEAPAPETETENQSPGTKSSSGALSEVDEPFSIQEQQQPAQKEDETGNA